MADQFCFSGLLKKLLKNDIFNFFEFYSWLQCRILTCRETRIRKGKSSLTYGKMFFNPYCLMSQTVLLENSSNRQCWNFGVGLGQARNIDKKNVNFFLEKSFRILELGHIPRNSSKKAFCRKIIFHELRRLTHRITGKLIHFFCFPELIKF